MSATYHCKGEKAQRSVRIKYTKPNTYLYDTISAGLNELGGVQNPNAIMIFFNFFIFFSDHDRSGNLLNHQGWGSS